MIEIVAFLACLYPALSRTTVEQLNCIAMAIQAMTGRITMLGISRWTDAGGSYHNGATLFQHRYPLGNMFLALLPHASIPPEGGISHKRGTNV